MMETKTTNTVIKTVGCNCPVLGFVFNNLSVFELVCKCIILSVIIPWGSIFLNSAVYEIFGKLNGESIVPAIILVVAFILLVLGNTLSVISIVRFSKKIKTVSR